MSPRRDERTIPTRPTFAEVDLRALRNNVDAVRARIGSAQIMAIVKANAYGHGLVAVSQALVDHGVEALGVAYLEEGIALRDAGVTAPILVLGGILGEQIEAFIDHDLEITASSVFKLEQIDRVAQRLGKRARVHLKVDTGMERIGVHWDTARPLLEAALAAGFTDVVAVFTHLAESDAPDPSYTELQLDRFEQALGYFDEVGVPRPMCHVANSGAILQHPSAMFDMVRPGCLLYGVYPSDLVARTIEVEPVLSLKSRVVYFKVIREGSSVSYNRMWTAKRDTRAVTIPVGYGDGFARAHTGSGAVLIRGRRYPIIGAITMDAMIADLGWDTAYNGDEVVLIGRQGDERIRVEDLARAIGTIGYEILTSINTRVPRIFVDPADE